MELGYGPKWLITTPSLVVGRVVERDEEVLVLSAMVIVAVVSVMRVVVDVDVDDIDVEVEVGVEFRIGPGLELGWGDCAGVGRDVVTVFKVVGVDDRFDVVLFLVGDGVEIGIGIWFVVVGVGELAVGEKEDIGGWDVVETGIERLVD